MQNFLEDILIYKREFIKRKKQEIPLHKLKERINNLSPAPDFKKAISVPGNELHLIAEVKKASPSAGRICKNFAPLELARLYEKSGASAISVITCEKFFEGDLKYLQVVANGVNLPVLRKDFIIDEYQIYEARIFGAGAVLLIACILTKDEISEFIEISKNLTLDCLVEIHSEEDLKKILDTPAEIIGINNRDLKTFTVDLKVTEKMVPLIPKNRIIVSESGIKTKQDICLLQKMNINAILMGQTLLEVKDVGQKIKELGFEK